MARSHFPFYLHVSHAALAALGGNADRVGVAALRAILRNAKSLEVAHQQIRVGDIALALSSRISQAGDLVVEIDLGDPRLAHRLVLADELAAAERKAREDNRKVREAERRLRQRQRW